jgi:hypothetical protein
LQAFATRRGEVTGIPTSRPVREASSRNIALKPVSTMPSSSNGSEF